MKSFEVLLPFSSSPFFLFFILSFGGVCLAQDLEGEKKEENVMTAILSKLEDISSRLQALEGEVAILAAGYSSQDNLLKIFQGIIEMEVARGEAIINKTCSVDQMATLQDSFLTKLETVKQSASEGLQNLQANFQNNLQTHTSSIRTGMTDLNASLQHLSSKEDINQWGNRIINVIPCSPPSAVVERFGCVTPVPKRLSWEAARQNCLDHESRLLEEVTSQEDMNLLKGTFDEVTPGYDRWIGLKDLRWVSGRDSLDVSSPLWHEHDPGQGNEKCGYICLGCSRAALADHVCSSAFPSLCQREWY